MTNQPIPKPMLADNKSIHTAFELLRFPVYGSPKIDGVRATVRDGVVYARSGDPIRNRLVQEKFRHLEWMDGELTIGDITAQDLCRKTSGIVNSIEKPIDGIAFNVFDHVQYTLDSFEMRKGRIKGAGINVVPQVLLFNLEEVEHFEDMQLAAGFEGVMLRMPYAPYKHGRATLREGYLMKLKRFTDAEFKVIGFIERQHNGNAKTKDAFGNSKRSSAKANKSGRGDLGAIVLEGPCGPFQCGSGWSDAERAEIWSNQDSYMGRLAKIKFFAKGMKDAPRHPTFLAWRDPSDL